MKVTIVSPEKTLYEAEAEGVKFPGALGQFEVLNGHAPIISVLEAGDIECKGSSPFKISITGGFVEVENNVVLACVEK